MAGAPDGHVARPQLLDLARRLRRRARPEPSTTGSASAGSACTSGCSRPAPGGEMIGEDGGDEGRLDDDFAAPASTGIGATIMGRNMFGPIRGEWGDADWTGWWGDDPPYHHPVFVLTHHAHDPIEMEGGTTFHFVTDGIEAALERAHAAAGGDDIRLGGGVVDDPAVPARRARRRDARRRSRPCCSAAASACSTTSAARSTATSARSSWPRRWQCTCAWCRRSEHPAARGPHVGGLRHRDPGARGHDRRRRISSGPRARGRRAAGCRWGAPSRTHST